MNNELYHYGVKGMKWGVRKSEYRAMNRAQRKKQRQEYNKTPQGRIERATKIATILGGPIAGIIAGGITAKRVKDVSQKNVDDVSQKTIDKGKDAVEKISSVANKTESKRVAELKSRITGKKENGKPAFLMSEEEFDDLDNIYMQRRKELGDKIKAAKNVETKNRLIEQADRLEDDYLSIVEQDYWYYEDL